MCVTFLGILITGQMCLISVSRLDILIAKYLTRYMHAQPITTHRKHKQSYNNLNLDPSKWSIESTKIAPTPQCVIVLGADSIRHSCWTVLLACCAHISIKLHHPPWALSLIEQWKGFNVIPSPQYPHESSSLIFLSRLSWSSYHPFRPSYLIIAFRLKPGL